MALDTVIEPLHLSKEWTIVVGDFNINVLDNENMLTTYMAAKGLICGIKQSTTNSRTCIDHIYTNLAGCTFGVGETYYSHHKIVWIAVH